MNAVDVVYRGECAPKGLPRLQTRLDAINHAEPPQVQQEVKEWRHGKATKKLTKLLTFEAGPLAPDPERKTIVGSLSESEAPSGTLMQ